LHTITEALRYAEKCGFKRKPFSGRDLFPGGEYNDVVGFSILDGEG
jgi:RimJ/RimL family protein N-acetyltransferase